MILNNTGADMLILEWRDRCAAKDREIERLREENRALEGRMLQAFRSVLFSGELPVVSAHVTTELVLIAREVKTKTRDAVISGTVHWIRENLVPFVHDEIVNLQSASSERKS